MVGEQLPSRAKKAIESLLVGDEHVVLASSVWTTDGDDAALALTNVRLILATDSRSADAVVLSLADLSSVSTAPNQRGRLLAFFCGETMRQIVVPEIVANDLVCAVRASLVESHPLGSDDPWWRDPLLDIGIALPGGVYLAGPDRSIEPGVPVYVSVVNAGVTVRLPTVQHESRFMIPWSRIRSLEIEGVDQARSRPSVGAVLAFGVLGLLARRTEMEAYLTVKADRGDYSFGIEGMLPTALRATLSPVLELLDEASKTTEGATIQTDPASLLRSLATLRDDGIITQSDFETKKAEILRRL